MWKTNFRLAMIVANVIIVATVYLLSGEMRHALAYNVCVGASPGIIDPYTRAAIENPVKLSIETYKGALISAELKHRNQLLSAMKVFTKQQALTGTHNSLANLSTERALTESIVATQTRMEAIDRVERFSSVGHEPCEVAGAGRELRNSIEEHDDDVKNVIDEVINKPFVEPTENNMEKWYKDIAGSEYRSAQEIFNGDIAEGKKYIDWVIGPPVPETDNNQVGSTLQRYFIGSHSLQSESRKSVAIYLLASVLVDSKKGGTDEKMTELSEKWIGDDGGKAWSATLAAAPMRGAFLDMARIEAANLIAEILAFKRQRNMELGVAVYALSVIDEADAGQTAIAGQVTQLEERR